MKKLNNLKQDPNTYSVRIPPHSDLDFDRTGEAIY